MNEKQAMFRRTAGGRRSFRLTPLERGWTSPSVSGKKFGPPIVTGPDGEGTVSSICSCDFIIRFIK